jgi:hypothetical protein
VTEARIEPVTTEPVTTEPAMSDAEVTRAFSWSVVISGIRCLIGYIVFPWLLPLLGVAKGVGPVIGVAIGVIAIGFNIASIRRFQLSRHRWRWVITALNVTVICLLVVLIARDVAELI